MWVSMCFPRAVDSHFIVVKKRPYSLAKKQNRDLGCSTGLPRTRRLPLSLTGTPPSELTASFSLKYVAPQIRQDTRMQHFLAAPTLPRPPLPLAPCGGAVCLRWMRHGMRPDVAEPVLTPPGSGRTSAPLWRKVGRHGAATAGCCQQAARPSRSGSEMCAPMSKEGVVDSSFYTYIASRVMPCKRLGP